jgi:hypothetical protein
MSIRFTAVNVLLVFIAALAALSSPAFAAENATITGDGVRLREDPSVTGDVLTVLRKGTRVEAKGVTNYSDTIDGYTAPWYHVGYGEFYFAFVFGKFIKPDAGVEVPPLDDPISYFASIGLYAYGKTESDVIKNLGEPVSRAEEKYSPPWSDGSIALIVANHTLRYEGIVAEAYEYEDGRRTVHKVTITTGSFSLWGLKVGSSVTDAERILGAPNRIDGDYLIYYNNVQSLIAGFFVRKGKVTEIIFEYESQG